MATRKLLLATLWLAAAASMAPAVSSAGVSIDIDVAPPPARVEVVPDARPGFVWAPGYWEWRGHRARVGRRPLDQGASRLSLGTRYLGRQRPALSLRAGHWER
jgi:hypothetical protein